VRIEDLDAETAGGARRVAARVIWEDVERPVTRVWFEAPEPFAADLSPDPHAFLLAAAIPALRAGESRVRIEGAVCPRLCAGLREAMLRLSRWRWRGSRRRQPAIEAAGGDARASTGRRRALFLSGGVDSLALLRRDRQSRPAGHLGAFEDAFFVDGFDQYWGPGGERGDFYERALANLRPAAVDAGVVLVPARTNLRDLDSAGAWLAEWLGAGTAAVAHAFSRRVGRASIAASNYREDLVPQGTHPEIDPLYSTAGLTLVHEGADERRLDRLARVAAWDAGLRALRVCWEGISPDGPLNCGRCHKCVLTRLELVALGRLRDCPGFPDEDVTVATTDVLRPTRDSSVGYFRELLAPLRARGRADLAEALSRRIAAHEAYARRMRTPRWWRRLRWGGPRHLASRAWREARAAAGPPPAAP
jgi:hypothetical protein